MSFVLDQVESQIALSTFGCNEKETPFINCLEWVDYEHKDGHWSFKRLRRLAVPYGLDYASVLNPGKALCLMAREPLGIIFDSAKNIATPLDDCQAVEGRKKKLKHVDSIGLAIFNIKTFPKLKAKIRLYTTGLKLQRTSLCG